MDFAMTICDTMRWSRQRNSKGNAFPDVRFCGECCKQKKGVGHNESVQPCLLRVEEGGNENACGESCAALLAPH
ncbi:hypothetical protein DUNSADRAFT_7032 [Dunaliella salina]|uniref:Encoded protein n=1 Tax=Dunaliella salina TaxID=3046 RepID=A0ABQ7GM59_DUNSA|nr:hypothetical protein DUNSADRAFT_7032 [Dunaliella salina]|eukprot:KAF5835672.1 hypothetical protein DUNSADRAFT_7032 [Dunaliella salina]